MCKTKLTFFTTFGKPKNLIAYKQLVAMEIFMPSKILMHNESKVIYKLIFVSNEKISPIVTSITDHFSLTLCFFYQKEKKKKKSLHFPKFFIFKITHQEWREDDLPRWKEWFP